MEFTVLLDAPREPKTRIQIAKLGEDFEHSKYGKFAITADDVETWQRNLSQLPDGRALIDADHQADRAPRNTEASGWITGVSLDGGTPTAEVEWTPKGKQAIEDKRYLFISPTYGPFTDEHGMVHENTLIGASLTNRPFLNMPAITLASEERVSAALDEDPAARFYTRALDGELGDTVGALVLLDVPQAERDQAVSDNDALPDGSYPIRNAKQLKAAAILAASKHGNWKAAQRLIRRRAKELGVELASLSGFGSGGGSDSRALMATVTPDLLKALGLDEDQELVKALEAGDLDETQSQKLLDAATGLREKADKEPEPTNGDVKTLDDFVAKSGKTLDQLVADSGKRLLDAEEFTKLLAQGAAGEQALKQLHEQRFEHAFQAALTHEDGAKVTPAERDQLHHFYTLDADATIALIEGREPIVPAKPSGQPVIELDLDEPADPERVAHTGLHPGSHDVYRKVQAKLKTLEKPQSEFSSVLEQMMTDGEL